MMQYSSAQGAGSLVSQWFRSRFTLSVLTLYLWGAGSGAVFAGPLALKTLGTGLYHTCAVLDSGKVRCTGSNSYGQLGKGGPSDYANNSGLGKGDLNRRQAFEVQGLSDAVSVSGGNMFTCAVRATGAVACWGQNRHGQLGNGAASDFSSTPVEVKGLTDAVAVAAGAFHACALKKDGTVWCWGLNTKGSLGHGSEAKQSESPVQVAGLSGATRLFVRGDASCAMLGDRSVRCWGEPASPRAFGKNPAPARKPVELFAASEGAVDSSMGIKTQCLLNAAGKIRCVGTHFPGLTATSKVNQVITAVTEAQAPSEPVQQILVSDDNGVGTFLCARLQSGSVECIGGGRLGQLAYAKPDDSAKWVKSAGIAGAKRLVSGQAAYTFVEVDGGKHLGWGFNNNLGGVAALGRPLEKVTTPTEPLKLVQP